MNSQTPLIRKHAFIRIGERTGMTALDVQHKLDNGKYYPIGKDTTKEHIHKVIHSETDDQLFIVVQDYATDEVITVLPMDYHNAWRTDMHHVEMLARQHLGVERKVIPLRPMQKVMIFVNFKTAVNGNGCSRSVKAGQIYDSELLAEGVDIGCPATRETLCQAIEKATPEIKAILDDIVDEAIDGNAKAAGLSELAIGVNIAFGVACECVTYSGYNGKALARATRNKWQTSQSQIAG